MPPNRARKNGEDCNFISCLFYHHWTNKTKNNRGVGDTQKLSPSVSAAGARLQWCWTQACTVSGVLRLTWHSQQRGAHAAQGWEGPPGTRKREWQCEGQGGPSEEDHPGMAKGLFQWTEFQAFGIICARGPEEFFSHIWAKGSKVGGCLSHLQEAAALPWVLLLPLLRWESGR